MSWAPKFTGSILHGGRLKSDSDTVESF